jgi:hypothetical protein
VIAIRLLNGRVLVSGGGNRCGDVFNTAAVFDPPTNTWSATTPMLIGRGGGGSWSGRCLAGSVPPSPRPYDKQADIDEPSSRWRARSFVGNRCERRDDGLTGAPILFCVALSRRLPRAIESASPLGRVSGGGTRNPVNTAAFIAGDGPNEQSVHTSPAAGIALKKLPPTNSQRSRTLRSDRSRSASGRTSGCSTSTPRIPGWFSTVAPAGNLVLSPAAGRRRAVQDGPSWRVRDRGAPEPAWVSFSCEISISASATASNRRRQPHQILALRRC